MSYILYFILIFSTIFQSLSIGDKLGSIAYSLTSIITPIIFIMYIFINRSINISIYTKKLVNLMVYLILVSLIAVFFYVIILNNIGTYWGQNLFIKGFRASMYFLDIILFLILIENLQNKVDINKIYYPFIFTYFVLFFVLLFEMYDPSLFNSIFHESQNYDRIRLLSSEASSTGTLIVIFFLSTLNYYINIKRNKKMILVSVVIFIIFLLVNRSKGLYVCLVITILYFVFKNLKINNLKAILKLILSLVFLAIICRIFTLYILQYFTEDIQKYTSVVTRVYTTLCAFKISVKYPFGIGTTLYPIVYTKELISNIYFLNHLNINFNLSEIISLIDSTTGKGVAAKISIAQYSMYWGILGTIYFLYSYWIKIYKNIKENNDILLFGFVFIFISIFTYASFENNYEIWCFLVLIYNFKTKNLFVDNKYN
ncbi:O-antigen polymerase [Clostridium tyrobutyricum]|uniref:O-antigen polymerase n=1 Tax=Clostridium tyrobutyricum TaxID=1519 RepID=UPI0030CD3613